MSGHRRVVRSLTGLGTINQLCVGLRRVSLRVCTDVFVGDLIGREPSFLDRFKVDEAELERIREDDEAMMRFAFRWLEFSLFGKPTIEMKATTES